MCFTTHSLSANTTSAAGRIVCRVRLSFQRFLGLGLDGTVPDATTVWLFRERLVQAKAIDKALRPLQCRTTDRGYLAMGRQIIDATVVPVPKQRNTEEEKAAIKEGRIPRHGRQSQPGSVRRIAMPAGA